MSALLLAAVLLPMVAAAAVAVPHRGREALLALAPWTPLPALALALPALRVPATELPWVMLGTRLGVDDVGRIFLLLTALLWIAAGLFARGYLRDDPKRVRFFIFHLLALSGNLGVVVAHDVVSFYGFFALMTFAAYPLVIHAGDAAALRAGRVYVAMAILGETLLLLGLLLAAAGAEELSVDAIRASIAASPHRATIVALLLGGFSVKAGALPLHVWLPLAHPVAPTPASAVLSGCMIKAGLLGWMRFLPLGDAAVPGVGNVFIALALASAFFGVLIGVTQTDAKTALAYSSISQMGIINLGIGIALANPVAWPTVRAACLAYVVHHGLAKGALFLGVGVAGTTRNRREGRWAMAGLAIAALAVAGAPLTSGSVAKHYLKQAAVLSPGGWPAALDWLLPLTAVGTTLLMARFLFVVRASVIGRHPAPAAGMWRSWGLLIVGVGVAVWVLPGFYELEIDPPGLPGPGSIWLSIWPVVAGGLLAWSALLFLRRRPQLAARAAIAPGDLLVAMEGVARGAGRWLTREDTPLRFTPVVTLAGRWYGVYADPEELAVTARMEQRLVRWLSAGVALVLVTLAILALLWNR